MCGTKNNEWKIYELSIQHSIDNCIKTTRIKSNFASLNSIRKSGKPYKQGNPGLFETVSSFVKTQKTDIRFY